MSGPLIPGVPINLGGVVYTMPPCGFDTLEQHAEELDKQIFGAAADTSLSLAKIKLTVDVVHGALRRNYPDMDRKLVACNLTADNCAQYLAMAISQSLPAAPPGLQGEGEGAKTLGESTGVASAPA